MRLVDMLDVYIYGVTLNWVKEHSGRVLSNMVIGYVKSQIFWLSFHTFYIWTYCLDGMQDILVKDTFALDN